MQKKKALVVVHGDFWGLTNANKIVNAALGQGLEVKIAVSQKAEGPDGKFKMDKIEALQEGSLIREKYLSRLLGYVDEHSGFVAQEHPAELMTFRALNTHAGNRPEDLKFIRSGP